MPGGGLIPSVGPNGGLTFYTPYNYSSYITQSGGSFGVGGYPLLNTTTGLFTLAPLTLDKEWNAVNWILNFGSSDSPSPTDEQHAIWQLLHPESGLNYVATNGVAGSLLTAQAAVLYNDALTHTDFIPGAGGLVAVLLVPTTPGSSATPYQGFLVPIPVPTTCTSTGSATLTKTASVTNANAFEIITYTYVVHNTGATTLSNLVVVDDNGTPNYTGDDVTVGTLASLAPGAMATFTNTAYLPISYFYQVGSASAFDTLIPQAIPASGSTMASLELTYLIDEDVTDNTYGTGASAGWAGNGVHTFAQEEGNHLQWSLSDRGGIRVSDFDANFIYHYGVSSTLPSGYGANVYQVNYGNGKYISSASSTLADNLNGYTKFFSDETNSPVGDANWQTISGYKVTVSDGIFGLCGIGPNSVGITNYLTTSEIAFGGKCGYAKAVSYCPKIVGSKVTSTAWLTATVCGCTTIVHAKASVCVTLNGCAQPVCNNPVAHICLQPVKCECTCAKCKAGDCSHCEDYGCDHKGCGKYSAVCPHGTQNYTVAGVKKSICW
jgi:hypothetical protein